MAIVLIRHGETAGNASRVIQHPDTPLSERGRAQALRLAERLAVTRVAGIVSSDYLRAAMTAEAIRERCAAPLVFDPALRERNFGELRGRAYAELDFDPFAPDYVPPGGESWSQLHARVDRAWRAIRERAAAGTGDLVVVTHGLVCHSLISRHLDTRGADLAAAALGNTALTRIELGPPWTVSLLACTAHLEGRDEAAGPSAIGP